MFGSNKFAPTGGRASAFFSRKRLPDRLAPYFFRDGKVCNFAISGQGEKEILLTPVFFAAAGCLPIVVLHNDSLSMVGQCVNVWGEKFGIVSSDGPGALWRCDSGCFEPFLGMRDSDVVHVLQKLVTFLSESYTASFEKVVRAHLAILRGMNCACSLSGLYYLCGFENLEEFQENIRMLNCSEEEISRILMNLGLSNEKHLEQFELFRSIIQRLAYEAERSGWSMDERVGTMSITEAVNTGAAMLLGINGNKSPLLLEYVGQELSLYSDRSMLVIVDDVRLGSSSIIPVLHEAGERLQFGIIGSNVLDVIGCDGKTVSKFCERLDRIVVLKHKVATTAEELIKLIGMVEIEKESRTEGMGKGYYNFLPNTKNRSVTYSRDDRERIKAEEILRLGDDQAILFNTETNEIIRL